MGPGIVYSSTHELPTIKPALNPIRWMLAALAAYTAPSSVMRAVPREEAFRLAPASFFQGICLECVVFPAAGSDHQFLGVNQGQWK